MKDKMGYFFKNLPKSKYVALAIIIISSIELAIVPTITDAPIVFVVIICQIVGGIIALLAITRGVLDLNSDIKVINKKYQEKQKKQGNASKVERNDSNENELSNEKEIEIDKKVVEINLEEKEVYDVEKSNVKESVLEALKQAKENLQNENKPEKEVQKEETKGKSR